MTSADDFGLSGRSCAMQQTAASGPDLPFITTFDAAPQLHCTSC